MGHHDQYWRRPAAHTAPPGHTRCSDRCASAALTGAGTVGRMEQPRHQAAKTIAFGVAGGLILANLAQGVATETAHLLVPLGASLFLSFAMEPAVARLARRMRRGVATFLVMLTSIAVIGGLIATGGAVLATEGSRLLDNLPEIAASLQRRLSGIGVNVDLVAAVSDGGGVDTLRSTLTARARALSGTALSGTGTALSVLFMVFYFSADGHRLVRSACTLLPAHRQAHVMRAWELAIEKAGGYLYSRIVLAAVSAVVHSIVFLAAGIDYPIPMGLWVGAVSQVVPVVGTYLAGALPVAIALGTSPGQALLVLGTIIVYQQIENLLLAPRVVRSVIDIHPLAGFVSILAGAALLGWVGALVAVPVCATAVAFTSAFLPRHAVTDDDGMPADAA